MRSQIQPPLLTRLVGSETQAGPPVPAVPVAELPAVPAPVVLPVPEPVVPAVPVVLPVPVLLPVPEPVVPAVPAPVVLPVPLPLLPAVPVSAGCGDAQPQAKQAAGEARNDIRTHR